ncbi:MAG: radical SAM protein [Verrucomicrobia bacterium]|nr:radical SAM protein [Verrucomicrobiota bacterium]
MARLRQDNAATRSALAAVWARLPAALRTPTQYLGRHYAGCGATIGAMPKCDFACAGCYLGEDANRAKPRPLAEIKAQLRTLRTWLGPAGNVQLTDGEVSLRREAEVIELIRYAREIGLVPMLMTHGETFRRKPGLLERLMVEGGLTEIGIHIDITQRGRRDHFARAQTEAGLDPLRAEFAGLIRSARKTTGRRLEAASTVTVTRENLAGVPGIVRCLLAHADAFKMVSFQPLAAVGRTDPNLRGVHPDELWEKIAEGAGDPAIRRGEGSFGHPSCSRFVQGLAVKHPQPGRPRLFPFYRSDQPDEVRALTELFDRVGGMSFRLDGRWQALRRAGGMAVKHGGFALTRLLPQAWKLWRRAGTLRGSYFCIVSHHFMSAAETATPEGQKRLDVCAFRVSINGKLEPMCAVNALGLREEFYRDEQAVAARVG